MSAMTCNMACGFFSGLLSIQQENGYFSTCPFISIYPIKTLHHTVIDHSQLMWFVKDWPASHTFKICTTVYKLPWSVMLCMYYCRQYYCWSCKEKFWIRIYSSMITVLLIGRSVNYDEVGVLSASPSEPRPCSCTLRNDHNILL